MDQEQENMAIYGRINALEYLLRTVVITSIGTLPNNVAVAEQYRARALQENSKTELTTGDPLSKRDTHDQMIASLNLWFDLLVGHLEKLNNPKNEQQAPRSGGGPSESGTKH